MTEQKNVDSVEEQLPGDFCSRLMDRAMEVYDWDQQAFRQYMCSAMNALIGLLDGNDVDNHTSGLTDMNNLIERLTDVALEVAVQCERRERAEKLWHQGEPQAGGEPDGHSS